MTQLPDSIRAVFFQVNAACAALPATRLSPDERPALGGHLQPGSARLVDLVAQALSFDAALYAEVPVTGAALAARQAEADAWLQLRDLLSGLAQRAADQYLVAQSDAVQTAGQVLAHLCRGPQPLVARDRQRRTLQQEGLWPALLHLHGARRRPAPRAPSALLRRRACAAVDRAYETARRRGAAMEQKKQRRPLAARTTASRFPTRRRRQRWTERI